MITISEEQKAIILGTLLGDGYIYQDRYGGCRLELKHSESQKDYVFWLHEKLRTICPGVPKERTDNHWYMDDGSLDFRPKSHCAFSLKTNAFTLEECQLLSEVLDNNFGVKSSVQYPLCRGKRYPQIYIGKNGRDEFIKVIAPFIINCFQYKLPPL